MSTSRLREAIRAGVAHRLLHWSAVLNGSKSSPPPDNTIALTNAAEKQSEASKEIATQQNWANRPEQYTPFGNVNWNAYQATDPATGQPVTRWQQTQTLSPDMQAALDAQNQATMQRSQLAQQFGERVRQDYSKPFDWGNLPGMSETPQGQMTGIYGLQQGIDVEPTQGATRQRIEDAMFNRMRPEHQFQEEAARTRLANQGLTPGSTAYNRELGRLGEQQAGERYNATMLAGQEQARLQQGALAEAGLFNQASQAMYGQELGANAQNFQQMQQMANYQNALRQQAISEQAQARGMSLNEMNALLHGQQVGAPQMPGFYSAQAGQAPNYLAAAQYGAQSGLDAYNAKQAGSQGMMSGLFGLGGALLGGPAGAALGTAIGGQLSGGGSAF